MLEVEKLFYSLFPLLAIEKNKKKHDYNFTEQHRCLKGLKLNIFKHTKKT